MKPCLALLALPLVLPIATTSAQSCGAGSLFKNDSLPDVPSGQFSFSVIPGLCEGEAAGSVFDLPAGSDPQKLTSVSFGFGSNGGVSGNIALVDIEIFDGVSFAGQSATLGPKVFDFEDDVGGNIQATSTAINVIDLSQFDIVVGGGAQPSSFVVAVRMLFNPNGSCASGFTSNFFTDNSQPGLFGCDPNITPVGKNLIDVQGAGWVDPALYTQGGIPLCPLFYSGNWVIRACGEGAAPLNPLQVGVSGSPAPPGGFINLTFTAPGYNGVPYLAAASLGSAPGTPVVSGNPPVVGNVPLNTDALFFLSLNAPGTFFNFTGLIGPAGTSPGIIFIPNDPGLSGLSFFVAFLAIPPAPNPYGISDAALVSIQ